MTLRKAQVALSLAALVPQVLAQWQGDQINTTICSWGQVRVNTINDTVYLDGGSQQWLRGYSNGHTDRASDDNFGGNMFTLNLGTTFDTSTDNLTALFSTLAKTGGGAANNLALNYRDGVMFANDDMLWLYGGLPRQQATFSAPPEGLILGYEKYQYGPHLDMWAPSFQYYTLENGMTNYITSGAGVSAPSENLGFYIAGMHGQNWGPIYDNTSAIVPSSNMIKVDMSEMRSPVWTNTSIPSYVPSRANGEAVWIPVGDSGVVVVVGGVVNPVAIFNTGLSSDQSDESKKESPAFMESVGVYDVAADEWYIQETTGETPPALTLFCSAYASASDGSSHNIYIYGGYDGLNPYGTPSDDVYVLSLPSFEWVKLYSGQSDHGRWGHRCVKPYPDQILALGGVNDGSSNQCIDMIQVFNLNTGKFQDTYDPTVWSEYKVPDLVSGQIGGDASGGATKTAPSSWTNASLASVFKTTYTKPIATFYPYDSTLPPTATPTSPPSSSSGSSFPPWAGAIIGVLLALLLFAAIFIWWLLRRKKRFEKNRRTSTASSGNRFRVLQWMYAGAEPKDNVTTVSNTFTHDTAVEQSVATETQGEPVYEMHVNSSNPRLPVPLRVPNGHAPSSTGTHRSPPPSTDVSVANGPAVVAPVELPTEYNDQLPANLIPLPSPTSISPSPTSPQGQGFLSSPVSPDLRGDEDGHGSPTRPVHHRNISSISSARSIGNTTNTYEDEDGRLAQRPRYLSGVSDVSSSEGGSRGLGLEDIDESHGRD